MKEDEVEEVAGENVDGDDINDESETESSDDNNEPQE
jgi:hypothetical protein